MSQTSGDNRMHYSLGAKEIRRAFLNIHFSRLRCCGWLLPPPLKGRDLFRFFPDLLLKPPMRPSKMENPGSSLAGPSMYLKESYIGNAGPSVPVIDLTRDSDADSGEDDDNLQELSPAEQERAMAAEEKENENDRLDVSELNYSFNLILNNSSLSPIKNQFMKPCNFLRQLDRHNTAYTFTVAQYRRAWRYAVKSKEEDFAVNDIVALNPGLDPARIEAIFMKQIQRLSDYVRIPHPPL